MLPKPPPREPALGFLYIHPLRVQGLSIGGEMTCISVPELSVGFDMGWCPRAMLPSSYVAISHGHMDHVGGLAYYCSQRRFQGMDDARIICDKRIAPDIKGMMAGYEAIERQVTPYELLPLAPDESIQIKNKTTLRGFETEHSVPSFGYSVIEHRTKLRDEFVGLPQEKLRELRSRGIEIGRRIEFPLVAYLGDTAPGAHLVREDVRRAKIVICECTFFEEQHRERARVGRHMHVDDLVEWLGVLECEALVVTHVTRRTNIIVARQELAKKAGDRADRVLILMDHRTNRARYEAQVAEALRREQAQSQENGVDKPALPG